MILSSSDLRFDEDGFAAADASYKASIASLRALKKEITGCFTDLRAGWDTAAGRAFFEKYQDDFTPALDKYINLLEYLQSCLRYSREQYSSVRMRAAALDSEL